MTSPATAPKPTLQCVLDNAQLPALPQTRDRLLDLSKNPNNGPAEFAIPIEADPGLAVQVLKFVNSSYFGFSRAISNVKHGIALVGVRTVKNFALERVFSLMPNPKCGAFQLKNLWQDSLRRALFARAAGKLLKMKDAEELFAAALLQDMAIPLLAKALPAEYAHMLEARLDGRRRLSDLEREQFGWTHAEVAAQMARKWNMPEAMARLVECHISIGAAAHGPGANPAEIAVAMSALLPTSMDATWSECQQLETIYNRLRAPTDANLGRLLAQIDREFDEFAPLLKLATPGKSLVGCYVEALGAGDVSDLRAA